MKKVDVAVIGYGHLGRWHVEKTISLETARLIGIVETDKIRAQKATKLYPNKKVVSSLDDIIDEIDCAIVATPTYTHFNIVESLLTKSKHVFCEKPLTSTLEDAMKIQKLAQNKNLVVQVGHSERFHHAWTERENFPDFFKDPGTVRMSRLSPYKGRGEDVDVVQDLMIHDLDLIGHLFNEVPSRVHSIGHKIRTDKWDYVISKFNFVSGREVFITVARNHIKEVRDLEITNKNGCLYVDLLNSEFHVARANSTKKHGLIQVDKYPTKDHLLEEQRHFYESILYAHPPIVGVEDGVLAVRLVEKVLEGLEKDGDVDIII